MTFEQLIEVVREWQSTLPPEEVRSKIADACAMISLGMLALPGVSVDVDAVLAFAASGSPLTEYDISRFLQWPKLQPPPCTSKRRSNAAARAPTPMVIDAVPLAPAPAETVASPPEPPPADLAKPARSPETRSAKRLLRALLRQPRAERDVLLAIEAAEIPPRVLAAAVAALGVQTADGQWRLPR